MKVGFVGLSHLGIVSSVCWANKFGNVVAVDTDEKLVEQLGHKELPIRESGLVIEDGIEFTKYFSVLSECSIVFISIDIETDNENVGRYDKFYDLVRRTILYLNYGVVMVIMSQVNVGTCENVKRIIQESRPDLTFDLVYMVETLIIGDAVNRFMNPERIILGVDDDIPVILERYLSKFGCPIIKMGYRSAELSKMSINFYLFNSIMFANTLSDICEEVGADMNEIIPALRSDRRIGKYSYIQPSLGVAGGNLERDMMSLKKLSGSGYIEILIEMNESRYRWVVEKIHSNLPSTKDSKITIWGLGYKKGLSITKNSMIPKIIMELDLDSSYYISTYDPLIKSEYDNQYGVLEDSDCLVILNDSDEFKNADIGKIKETMKNLLIIDCSNALLDRIDELKDFKYISIGRKS